MLVENVKEAIGELDCLISTKRRERDQIKKTEKSQFDEFGGICKSLIHKNGRICWLTALPLDKYNLDLP